jgi:hypothetical protein
MEEIAWETQAHFRYDMECNIQSVSRTLGCNFKSEFTTPKKKKKKKKKVHINICPQIVIEIQTNIIMLSTQTLQTQLKKKSFPAYFSRVTFEHIPI